MHRIIVVDDRYMQQAETILGRTFHNTETGRKILS